MPPYPLTYFEMQRYYQNRVQLSSKKEPKFNGVYSRNNLPKTKNGADVINLDEFKSVGTHWIALHVYNNNNVTYFESFGVDHIPTAIKKVIGKNNLKYHTS